MLSKVLAKARIFRETFPKIIIMFLTLLSKALDHLGIWKFGEYRQLSARAR